MKIFKIIISAKKILLEQLQSRLNNKAREKLQKNKGLWQILYDYKRRSNSTGCSYADYLVLYNYIRTAKPREVLECGTGVSTIVMAYAMMENEKEGGLAGRVTSMEEIEEWHSVAKELLPEILKKYVDCILSPATEDYHAFFRGIRYKDVPDRPYEFVFVDGPNTKSKLDSSQTFDFDFIRVVKKSQGNVCGIIDMRHSTCYVLQEVFGPRKFRYDHIRNLGFVGPVRRGDIKETKDIAGAPIARPFRLYRFCKQSIKGFLNI